MAMEESKQLRRPRRTLPDLRSASAAENRPRLTKVLLNVTIQGSLGPVHVIMTPESTVGDLIATAVRQYVKDGRRPMLPTADPSGFDLHYSQFSLERLGRDEELMSLGSRNFFLCRPQTLPIAETDGAMTMSAGSCSKEAQNVVKTGFSWLKFIMHFSL